MHYWSHKFHPDLLDNFLAVLDAIFEVRNPPLLIVLGHYGVLEDKLNPKIPLQKQPIPSIAAEEITQTVSLSTAQDAIYIDKLREGLNSYKAFQPNSAKQSSKEFINYLANALEWSPLELE